MSRTNRFGWWLSMALAVGVLSGTLLVAGVPSAWAGSATYSGTLDGSIPTYIHPQSDCTDSSPSPGVFYHAQTFTVDTTGTYTLSNVSNTFTVAGNQPNDSYFVLYQGSFAAGTPATNCIAVNDDRASLDFRSQIVVALTASVSYILVTSPYDEGTRRPAQSTRAPLVSPPGSRPPAGRR